MSAAAITSKDARMVGRLVRLPPALTRSRRRRRITLVVSASLAALTAAIGVAGHRPGGLAFGLFLGCAIASARFITEPQFVRLEGLGLWPPPQFEPEPKA